jgi:hypothetical protein
MYYQAESIRIKCQETDPKRKTLLKEIEGEARRKGYYIVANNIAIDLARATTDERDKLELLESVLSKPDDPYNRIRAVLSKANYLTDRNRPDHLTLRDQHLLFFAYSFLFCQRMAALFAQCHSAIWKLMKSRGDIVQLLRVFRLSSFLWRIRGEDGLENRYLSDMQELDLSDIRKLADPAVRIDLAYIDRRIQKAIAGTT